MSGMKLKTLVNGYAGSGKSRYLLTHPKIAWLITEPGSEILLETHPELAKNVIWKEEFIASPLEDIKAVFERLDKAVIRAHQDAKDGKIETLGLDNMTFLSENRWIYINKYEKTVTTQGALDTRGMYGTLGRWLYSFTLTSLLSFPGNVIATCHEQMENEDAMELRADKSTPISPSILGGFREKADTLFSASIYLDKKRMGDNQYKYVARCQKGNQRNAKNRYGLPELVEDISYHKIIETINANKTKAA